MRGLWKLTVLEIKLSLREPMAAFFTLTFQLMMLFLFGSIYGDKTPLFFGGYGPVDASVPAYTAMIVATSGLLSLAIAVASYREHRMLRRLRATTLHPRAILGAQVIVIFLMRALGMALLFIAGRSVYALRFTGNGLECANSFCSELYELLCPRSSGGWSFAYGTHSSDCRHGFFLSDDLHFGCDHPARDIAGENPAVSTGIASYPCCGFAAGPPGWATHGGSILEKWASCQCYW